MANTALKEKLHRERIDGEVRRILESDESRMGSDFTECTGIDSATGKLIRFNSRDLDEGRITYDDIVGET